MGYRRELRSILILGAGYMQLPAIRAARRIGLWVIAADGNQHAVGRNEADEFLHIDLKAMEEMADAAVRLIESRKLSAVFTAGTDFSATVAYVAEAAGLPGTPYASAVSATDKFQMREVLREAGVRVPDYAVVSGDVLADGLPEDVRSLALPLVVKPADSMGARGVVRADEWEDVLRYARTAAGYSRTNRVVVEGYIPGPEFSVDALVFGESVQITGFADRHIDFPPFFIETGHTIPSSLSGDSLSLVIEEFIRGVRALGLGPGAAKGDMKLSPSGPVVGEIANRLSGGYMSGWTYPYATGVPLSELGIRVALGESPGSVRPARSWTSAERGVISIPGTIRSIDGVDAAGALPLVEDVIVLREPGDRVRFPQNNVEKLGNIISAASERSSATRAAERAVGLIVARLATLDPVTEEFLFGPEDPETLHWAYPQAGEADGQLRVEYGGTERGRPGVPGPLRIQEALLASNERDWSYRTIRESVDLLKNYHNLSIAAVDRGQVQDAFSRRILRALLRGGLQGALYAVDCAMEC